MSETEKTLPCKVLFCSSSNEKQYYNYLLVKEELELLAFPRILTVSAEIRGPKYVKGGSQEHKKILVCNFGLIVDNFHITTIFT